MLTALTINTYQEKNPVKRLINKVKGNKINVSVKSSRGVSLRHIQYENITGKVNWSRLDSVIGAQRNHLLCDEKIIFPPNMGFKRFQSDEFNCRLCTNMGLYILSKLKAPEKIDVALYDKYGENSDLTAFLLKFSRNVTVVTENIEVYRRTATKIIEKTGAAIIISSKPESLSTADLIIAPCQIDCFIPVKETAVVLTGASPTVFPKCKTYYNYIFKIPNKFNQIKPSELSDNYFSSALYTKACQHQFGSIVPTACANSSSCIKLQGICTYFNGFA